MGRSNVIWIVFVVAIAIFALLFMTPGIRLLTDEEFRSRYLMRGHREYERVGRALPRMADWLRIADIWGGRASEPNELRSVGWLLTLVGGVSMLGLLAGLIATAAN